MLTPITVQAGAYTAGNEHGSTLTALEVVSTPGATADIARAMQTLPGVQNVDEGTGLFVRGGDVSETKVLLNNMVMLSPYNYRNSDRQLHGDGNPFLLDGIFFSSGGFGARYGNILSGVADLRTAGRPVQSSETAVAGLASVSSGADLALGHGLASTRRRRATTLHLLFKLNGVDALRTRQRRTGTTSAAASSTTTRPTARSRPSPSIAQRARHRDRRSVVQRRLFVRRPEPDVQSGWTDVFGKVSRRR